MRCRHCKLFDYNEVGEPCCYLLPIADETCRLLYYNKPRELGEFGIARAPMSWCYVEEVVE